MLAMAGNRCVHASTTEPSLPKLFFHKTAFSTVVDKVPWLKKENIPLANDIRQCISQVCVDLFLRTHAVPQFPPPPGRFSRGLGFYAHCRGWDGGGMLSRRQFGSRAGRFQRSPGSISRRGTPNDGGKVFAHAASSAGDVCMTRPWCVDAARREVLFMEEATAASLPRPPVSPPPLVRTVRLSPVGRLNVVLLRTNPFYLQGVT